MPKLIPTTPEVASLKGVKYMVANGATILPEGKRRFNAFIKEGRKKTMVVHTQTIDDIVGKWKRGRVRSRR